jgi:broad specificity phosphatase PhoE
MQMNKHYLIRHAHRPDFQPGDFGLDVSITTEGRQAAEDLGCQFSDASIEMLWTSPVKRCVQSAVEIRRGMGKDVPIRQSQSLGDPGFLIADATLAKDAFDQHALLELITRILEGRELPGFYPLEVGCQSILKELSDHRDHSSVSISHDINICTLACWIFKVDQPALMMPAFLEGIEFSYHDEGMFADYKGRRTMIDETSLRGIDDSIVRPAFSKRV